MNTEFTYRQTYAAGASTIGLMIAMFDTLVGDFQRAAEALKSGDIQARCKELDHAALVVGQLENWLDQENGGEPAQILSSFYAMLRIKMLDAAAKQSPDILEESVCTILQVRSSWQRLDEMPVAEDRGNGSGGQGSENSDAKVSLSFSA